MTPPTPTPHGAMPELLPCPFCGGSAARDCVDGRNLFWVECRGDCMASGAIKNTEFEAVTTWNTRAAIQQAAVAVPEGPTPREWRALLKRLHAVEQYPTGTCPSSRHVAMMGEYLIRGLPYPMLGEEPQHCAESMLHTVIALWEARALAASPTPPASGGSSDHLAACAGGRVQVHLRREEISALRLLLLRRVRPEYGWMEAALVSAEAIFDPLHTMIHNEDFAELERAFHTPPRALSTEDASGQIKELSSNGGREGV